MSFNYESCELIKTPAVTSFLAAGIKLLPSILGKPSIGIQEVQVRRYKGASCNLLDAAKGSFAILLTKADDDPLLFGQLAHEIGHLRDATVYDAYGEGLCTLFSERLVKSRGGVWSAWESYYQSDAHPFYSRTYKMITELEEIVGADAVRQIFDHVTTFMPHRRGIAIEAWIKEIPSDRQAAARAKLRAHRSGVEAALPRETCFEATADDHQLQVSGPCGPA